MAATKRRHSQLGGSDTATQPLIPINAVFSFLREMKGEVSWTADDMAKSLKISAADAKRVLALLQLQGYVKAEGKLRWITTSSGETVAGARVPRFNREAVETVLGQLSKQIAQVNDDKASEFKIIKAVAFGDFLRAPSRVQAPDIGIELTQRGSAIMRGSVQQHRAMREFLKKLRARRAILNLHLYEEWMGGRSHRDLMR